MKDSVDNPPTPPTSNIWTNKIEGASNLKMGKKNAMENSLPDSSKKVCLCSPTTHAGSFKCRLHRLDATQKTSSGRSTSTTQSFDLGRIPSEGGKVDDQPQFSRFGRVAAATADAQLPTTTLQQFEHFK